MSETVIERETKLHAANFYVPKGGAIGPAPWTNYPYGVELAQAPTITCDEGGAHVRLVLRCDPNIGRALLFIPAEKPADSSQGKEV